MADTWGIVPLAEAPPSGEGDFIVVKISDDNALVFAAGAHSPLHNFVLVQTTFALAIIVLIILFLSLYAVRWITSPLSSIAAAARSFGHSSEEGALSAQGPREIAQVAEALNDMRKRVRSLVDERTQMLAAISHDLRTPLTRLRLRTERLSDVNVRDSMLQDIATINDMLGETLAYLRDGGQQEPVQLIDLPSLLQTICAQFSDFGHDVSYQGPDRFAFACRAHALNRAVTNVVDNAVKHGAVVAVALRNRQRNGGRNRSVRRWPGHPGGAARQGVRTVLQGRQRSAFFGARRFRPRPVDRARHRQAPWRQDRTRQ